MANLEHFFGATSASKALLDLPIAQIGGEIWPEFTSGKTRLELSWGRADRSCSKASHRDLPFRQYDRRPERASPSLSPSASRKDSISETCADQSCVAVCTLRRHWRRETDNTGLPIQRGLGTLREALGLLGSISGCGVCPAAERSSRQQRWP